MRVTQVPGGGGVGCALTRLLRPEADPFLAVLDAWPLSVPDLVGDSRPESVVRTTPGGGLGTGLERLLRPDRQVMLLAIFSLDLTGDDLVASPARRERSGEPPGRAPAA